MLEGPYPVPSHQAAAIQRRLCETRAWCLKRFNPADPCGSLRSSELKPQRQFTNECAGPNGRTQYDYLTTDERVALVDQLADRRSTLVKRLSLACPDWSSAGEGELLVVEINYSMWDGMAELESDGFVDVYDIPAWDTWVHLQSIGNTEALLCWIPKALIEHVNKAISVTPSACLGWVDRLALPLAERKLLRWF